MADRELPSPELLRKLLSYDPETGLFTWRWRDADFFKGHAQAASHRAALYNSIYAGKPALISADKNGYLRGKVLKRTHSAHRIAWAIHYDEWPDGEIDHINHDRSDNRISNLRVVTTAENRRNLALSPKNKSGVAGVLPTPEGKKWIAQIRRNDAYIYLGRFDRFEDAVEARRNAERDFGYHPNHCKAADAIEAGEYRSNPQ